MGKAHDGAAASILPCLCPKNSEEMLTAGSCTAHRGTLCCGATAANSALL